MDEGGLEMDRGPDALVAGRCDNDGLLAGAGLRQLTIDRIRLNCGGNAAESGWFQRWFGRGRQCGDQRIRHETPIFAL